MKRESNTEISVLLHNIRSVHNVGSIFRTADTAGVSKIYLSGYSPLPVDRFGRVRKDFAKVSLGAEKSVGWEAVSDPLELIRKLKKEKYKIIALEQAENSVDYTKVKIAPRTLLVVGNEVGGVEQEILNDCHAIAEIPMRGTKESLNVSVACGVFLFRLID